MTKETITVIAVGDIRVDREDPESIVALNADFLRGADITFGQLETTFSSATLEINRSKSLV